MLMCEEFNFPLLQLCLKPFMHFKGKRVLVCHVALPKKLSEEARWLAYYVILSRARDLQSLHLVGKVNHSILESCQQTQRKQGTWTSIVWKLWTLLPAEPVVSMLNHQVPTMIDGPICLPFVEVNKEGLMTRAVLPTPATPSYCAAMTVGTMVKRFAHARFLVACLWVQPLFTLSVPCDIFRTPALIWGWFIDSGNQVGRTRSDIQAAGPRRCQSQIVVLLLGCKAGLISYEHGCGLESG